IAGRIDLVDFAIAVLVVRVVALLRHHLDGVRVDVWIAVRAVPLVRRKPVVIDVVVGPTGSAIDHPSAPRRRAAEVEAALPRRPLPRMGSRTRRYRRGTRPGGGPRPPPTRGGRRGRASRRPRGQKAPPPQTKRLSFACLPLRPPQGGGG